MKSLWNQPILFCLTVALLATALTGCKDTPSAYELEWEIERQIPGAELERESHVHLGRLAMGFAKKIVRWATPKEDEEDLKFLFHVKKVCVATYRVVSMPSLDELDTSRLERKLTRNGWEPMVRQKEDGERTWVYTRGTPDGGIRNLFVVSLDNHELTVVDVAGRLDRVIAEAMADDPGQLAEILGP